MKRRLGDLPRTAFVAIVVLASIAIGDSARAVPVLDQSFEAFNGASGFVQGVAQTFEVGITGTLTRVEIPVQGLTGVTFGILPTTVAGAPTPFSQALATVALADYPFNGLGFDWIGIDLTPFDIQVTAGELLAWSLIGGPTQLMAGLGFDGSDPYSGGSSYSSVVLIPGFPPIRLPPGAAWQNDRPGGFDADNGFRVYVEPAAVAEPATILLLGVGSLALAWTRRRRGAFSLT